MVLFCLFFPVSAVFGRTSKRLRCFPSLAAFRRGSPRQEKEKEKRAASLRVQGLQEAERKRSGGRRKWKRGPPRLRFHYRETGRGGGGGGGRGEGRGRGGGGEGEGEGGLPFLGATLADKRLAK